MFKIMFIENAEIDYSCDSIPTLIPHNCTKCQTKIKCMCNLIWLWKHKLITDSFESFLNACKLNPECLKPWLRVSLYTWWPVVCTYLYLTFIALTIVIMIISNLQRQQLNEVVQLKRPSAVVKMLVSFAKFLSGLDI